MVARAQGVRLCESGFTLGQFGTQLTIGSFQIVRSNGCQQTVDVVVGLLSQQSGNNGIEKFVDPRIVLSIGDVQDRAPTLMQFGGLDGPLGGCDQQVPAGDQTGVFGAAGDLRRLFVRMTDRQLPQHGREVVRIGRLKTKVLRAATVNGLPQRSFVRGLGQRRGHPLCDPSLSGGTFPIHVEAQGRR